MDNEADKIVFPQKLKAEVEAKDGMSLLAGAKAIGEAVHDLHTEVFQPSEPLRPSTVGGV